MKFTTKIFVLLYRELLWLAAKRGLPAGTKTLMKRYSRELVRDFPKEETLGARLVMALVVNDLALFEALMGKGHDRARARAVVAKGNRGIFSPVLALLRSLRGRFGDTPVLRARNTYLFMNTRFPFANPGWHSVEIESADDAITGVDYTRCPIADYLVPRGAADMCGEAICALDHDVAESLGVILDRQNTIASGCSSCTFRWHDGERAKGKTAGEKGNDSGLVQLG